MSNNPKRFPFPPIRTPVMGNPPKDIKVSGQFSNQSSKTSDNVHSWPWQRWFQQVGTTMTSPVQIAVPASATANGTAGMIATDGTFVYVCVATNQWKRTAIATW